MTGSLDVFNAFELEFKKYAQSFKVAWPEQRRSQDLGQGGQKILVGTAHSAVSNSPMEYFYALKLLLHPEKCGKIRKLLCSCT